MVNCKFLNFPYLQDTLETFDKKAHMDKVHLAWTKLQTAVNTVFDSDLDKLSTDKQNGIKQVTFVVLAKIFCHCESFIFDFLLLLFKNSFALPWRVDVLA